MKRTYTKALTIMLLFSTLTTAAKATPPAPGWIDQYDVVWNTPSADARGSMPIGNGEVTVNAWVERDGDLRLLIGRSDSFSEIGRLLKVGQVRISLSPNPIKSATFAQHLHVRDGYIDFTAGAGFDRVDLTLFLDQEKPIVHLEGHSFHTVTPTVTIESWRTAERTVNDDSAWGMQGAPYPLIESADHFPTVEHGIAWYHRNESSVVPKSLAQQGLAADADKVHDPLLYRTFGGFVVGTTVRTLPLYGSPAGSPSDHGRPAPTSSAESFNIKDAHTLIGKPSAAFSIAIACPSDQPANAASWIDEASTLATKADAAKAFEKNLDWWRRYWNNAWIDISSAGSADAAQLTRGYTLQRYMQACDSRGAYPVKFNGGAFTVGRDEKPANSPGGEVDPDYRRWGDPHWFQNVRHMYHPMMASGDIEMTDPFFALYEHAVPLAEGRSRAYENVDGVFFPETMTVWGAYAGLDYGWDRSKHPGLGATTSWWGKTRNQGPELVALMLDRWDYTQDRGFLEKQLLPMAVDVLTYFDHRYARDAQGKIVLDPTQSVETFWNDVVNDTPTIAALRDICTRLCALPADNVSVGQQKLFARMLAACPDIPITEHTVDGKTVKVIAPAEKHETERHNVENPELYAVWPSRLYGLGKPGLQMARDTYAARVNHLDLGWGYDGNCAAILGMADEAARILEVKCKNSNPDYRWPAMWGPNFDWLPDQNHGGNLLETAQLMLLQCDGRKILLFPAWPRDWDVDFKLHAAYRTTIEATLKGGKIVRLKVTPEARAKDIVDELGTP